MNVLFIDTSTHDLIAAVVKDGQVYDASEYCLGAKHSERLCIAVQNAIDKAGIEFKDIDCYAVTVGPGSFTGIRIGISTVKGYLTAIKKPVITVNALSAIVASFNSGGNGSAVIDAGNGFYFGQTADFKLIAEPSLIAYEDGKSQNAFRAASASEYFSGALKIIANCTGNRNFSDNPTPVYIRKSQAEEKR